MIHEATRTLVKSPPEVWEQCSDPESLSRHLNGSFGEIRITRLEPESTVAWEGERGSGTVTIEPSAWGTRVTLVAETQADYSEGEAEDAIADLPEPADPPPEPMEDPPEPADHPPEPPDDPPEPDALPAAWQRAPGPPRDRLARLLMRFRRGRVVEEPAPPAAAPEPEPRAAAPAPEAPEPESEPPPADEAPDGSAILMAALESMGQAHHRPYSRG